MSNSELIEANWWCCIRSHSEPCCRCLITRIFVLVKGETRCRSLVPSEAMLLPPCGVPQNTSPYVERLISPWLSLCGRLEWIRAFVRRQLKPVARRPNDLVTSMILTALTTIPPKLCARNIIGLFSVYVCRGLSVSRSSAEDHGNLPLVDIPLCTSGMHTAAVRRFHRGHTTTGQ